MHLLHMVVQADPPGKERLLAAGFVRFERSNIVNLHLPEPALHYQYNKESQQENREEFERF